MTSTVDEGNNNDGAGYGKIGDTSENNKNKKDENKKDEDKTETTVDKNIPVKIQIPAKIKFSDVSENTVGFKAIMALIERGVIKGFEDGTFRPKEKITRA